MENKKIEKYLSESSKTLANTFVYDNKNENEPDIYHFCKNAIEASNQLDLVKKKKFYGKKVNLSSSAPEDIKFIRDNKGENLLHAAIGMVTEASELLDTILKYKYGEKELDVVNIKEEIGDVMWYLAIFLRDLNIDLYESMDVNIAKLRARYGEKFSSEKAINRDLETERQILENGSVVTESRELENGGMKPPKNDWKSYTQSISITEDEKQKLKEELRDKLSHRLGLPNNPPDTSEGYLSLKDVGDAFGYLENFDGNFIVKVLSNQEDIKKAEDIINANLSIYKKDLDKVNKIALSLYDFTVSKNEQSRFILITDFDQMTGVLKFSETVGSSLNSIQQKELDRFLSEKGIVKN